MKYVRCIDISFNFPLTYVWFVLENLNSQNPTLACYEFSVEILEGNLYENYWRVSITTTNTYMYVLLDFTVNFLEEIELQSILAYFNVLRTILFVFSSPYKWEDLTESPFAKDCFTTVVNTPDRICCVFC